MNNKTGRKKGLLDPEIYTHIGKYAINTDKFFSRLVEDKNGCQVWTGGTHRQGYGMTSIYNTAIQDRQMNVSHRVAMMIELGRELKREEFVVHEFCDNPLCCNIDHLILGDAVDRNRVQYAKGRKPGHIPNAGLTKQNREYKYTDEEMRLMRDGSIDDIVAKFKCSRSAASHMRYRMKKGYKWL